MPEKEPVINKERIEQYLTYQREQERSKDYTKGIVAGSVKG